MKIINLKKYKNNTYLVTLENQMSAQFYDDIIVKYSLIPKKEVTKNEWEEIQKENNSLASYYHSLQFLTRKKRTKNEVKRFLEKQKYEKQNIENTINRLENEGYLKEDEYIVAYLNDSLRFSNDGPLKIKNKLIDLGCSENNILEKLEEIQKEEWLNKLTKLYEKKIKSKHTDGFEKWKLKCQQYLVNLGYPLSWINEISLDIDIPNDETLIFKELDKIKRKWSRKYEGTRLIAQIKRKLHEKGFSKEEIDLAIEKELSD